jgi:hypothetical protein
MPDSTNPDPALSEEEEDEGELAQVANSVASLLEELGVLGKGNTDEDEYLSATDEEQPHSDLEESAPDDIKEIWRTSKEPENMNDLDRLSNSSNSRYLHFEHLFIVN